MTRPDAAADGTGGPASSPDEEGPIGLFQTWKALYTSVVVYALVLILIFYVLSVSLDFSGP